jgi:DNA-directed RNA polymerase subunit RPC12/RpoP
LTAKGKSHGLVCPNCGGVVPVPEGVRVVTCPYCDMRSLVQGERGIRRWQVNNRLERPRALEAVKGFFSGFNKARDIKRRAQITDLFLVYLPHWRVTAFVAGWLFGRVKSGKDNTKPVEVEVLEEMAWNDAAVDVSEFGVHRIVVRADALEPFNSETLHAQAMIFEPVESPSEALEEARQHFIYRGQSKLSLKQKYFEKFHMLRQRLSIVYYPLWIARYRYRERSYQVVIDGVSGEVLLGKAPGNIFYRAAMLVGGMALGTFLLVNGTIVAGGLLSNSSSDNDGCGIILLPIALGIGLVVAGYRRFRYGEEVESIQQSARKARLAGDRPKGLFSTGFDLIDGLSDLSDLSDLDKLR